MLTRQVFRVYEVLDREGYFQQDFAYDCVDAGYVPGALGHDLEGVFLLELRKPDLWPIYRGLQEYRYSEDDLLDVLEFLHEHCSMPTKCQYHGFSDCGYHCTEFDPDREKGRREIREKINPILEMYGTGYELSADGEILEKGETHLDALLTVSLPPVDRDNVETRVEAACTEFRRHRSSLSDRRQALRELADVLEFLRPQLRKVLTKADESDLFNLLNNFGIRHHTTEQKTDYDKPIFYSWMFYHHLAAIHAGIRLIKKANDGI